MGSLDAGDGAQTVSLLNIGNSTLTHVAPGLAIPADFKQVTGNPSDCSSSFSLTAGQSCNLRIEFYPANSGALNESLAITDNALGGKATQSIALSGVAASVVTLSVSPSLLTNPVIGGLFSQSFSASGGASPYSFSLASGSPPFGLSLSSGALTGTPTATGSFSFSVQTQDSTGSGSGGPDTGSQSYTVTIAAPTISVSPGVLPGPTVGSFYSQNISASGGSGSYADTVTSGSLPAGLSLDSSTGVLSGTPTTAGPTSFTITAADTVVTGI